MIDEIARALGGRRILVTGHTGFKGAWLSLWLSRMGAKVTGLSLPPDQGDDNLYDRAHVGAHIAASHFIDIRDEEAVRQTMAAAEPEIIFHLAAQPLVRRAYAEPVLTFATNIMGTAHVLEAAREIDSVKATVCVTTDKVYDNKEWTWPYRETDGLGGKDPYSASKAACEMVARSYMTALRGENGGRMATARGGNVVGGGDWSQDRLIPDIVRAIRMQKPLVLRYPGATRPWQHVLELCFGYMMLAARLLQGRPDRGESPKDFEGSFNFGPDATHEMTVEALVRTALDAWERPDYPVELGRADVYEANFLRLDSSLARSRLGWRPILNFAQTIGWTARWYRSYCATPDHAFALIQNDIATFETMCRTTRID